MFSQIPLLALGPVVGPIVVAGLFVLELSRAADRVRLRSAEKRTLVTGVALFIALWFVSGVYLASRNVFDPALPVPTLPIALIAPLLASFAAFRALPNLRNAILAIPQERLIGIQSIRLVGFGFLLLVPSTAPALFAFVAGAGDMLVGFEAIVVARLYANRAASAPTMGMLWNALGIADFTIALTIGFLASSTPLQLIHVTPNTDFVTVLPFVLVPIFGIPLFLMLHAASLAGILQKTRTTAAL